MITEIRGLDVPVKMSVLPNGLTVITAQTDSELVKVQFTLRVGSANEEKGQEGIAHYLEHALFEGPARNDVHPLFKDLSWKGVLVNATTSYHYTEYNAVGLSEDFISILSSLYTMIFQPLFSNTTVAAERSVIIQELTQRSSGKEFSHWILKRLFPLHSFLSRSVCGSVSSIKRINRSKLIAFHDTYYSLANTALIVAGHVSHDDVIDKVSTYDSRCHSVTPFLPWIHPEIGMWKFKENNSSSALDLHFPGISSQRDSIIANVVFRMLVFPPFGFLHQKLRQERGIIYGLSGNTGEFPKSINIWNIPSDVQWHDEIIKIITETLHEFVRNEYDQKYFEYQRTFERMRLAERAEKKRKTFSYPDNLSDSWLRQDFDFEEERYLHEMTRDDLTDVARRFFNPSTMGVVRIVPKKKK